MLSNALPIKMLEMFVRQSVFMVLSNEKFFRSVPQCIEKNDAPLPFVRPFWLDAPTACRACRLIVVWPMLAAMVVADDDDCFVRRKNMMEKQDVDVVRDKKNECGDGLFWKMVFISLSRYQSATHPMDALL